MADERVANDWRNLVFFKTLQALPAAEAGAVVVMPVPVAHIGSFVDGQLLMLCDDLPDDVNSVVRQWEIVQVRLVDAQANTITISRGAFGTPKAWPAQTECKNEIFAEIANRLIYIGGENSPNNIIHLIQILLAAETRNGAALPDAYKLSAVLIDGLPAALATLAQNSASITQNSADIDQNEADNDALGARITTLENSEAADNPQNTYELDDVGDNVRARQNEILVGDGTEWQGHSFVDYARAQLPELRGAAINISPITDGQTETAIINGSNWERLFAHNVGDMDVASGRVYASQNLIYELKLKAGSLLNRVWFDGTDLAGTHIFTSTGAALPNNGVAVPLKIHLGKDDDLYKTLLLARLEITSGIYQVVAKFADTTLSDHNLTDLAVRAFKRQ